MVSELATRRRSEFAASVAADEERRFLNGVFLGALALRAVIGLLIIFLELQIFNGDNLYYETSGWELAQQWNAMLAGRVPAMAEPLRLNVGMELWVGTIYFVAGVRLAIIPLAINWALGAANALLIYHIARQLFGFPVARRASMFVAYMPSFAIWSALLYKDALVLFCIGIAILAILQMQRGLRPRYALLAAIALLSLQFLRAYVAYLMLAAVMIGLLFAPRRATGLSRLHKTAMVAAILGFAIAGGGMRRARTHYRIDLLRQIVASRSDLARSAASGYLLQADIATPTSAALFVPKGLVYLLLSPFPWQWGGARQLLAVPETVIWWCLVPATVRGAAYAWRHRRAQSLVIFVFTILLALFYSLLIANVGTAVRERTQIVAFWLIFAAAGIELKRRGQLAKDSTL